jgi:hypothetical protein
LYHCVRVINRFVHACDSVDHVPNEPQQQISILIGIELCAGGTVGRVILLDYVPSVLQDYEPVNVRICFV